MHVRFRDLDFIITVGGELALAHAAIQPLPSIGLNYERLEHQLGVSLGPQPSREDQRRLTFSNANNMAWLARGEPLSLEHHIRSAPTVLPFGLRNAAATVSHLVAQRMIPSPMNNEFVGMIESITESLHGLLAEGPGSDSSSDSSRGSHHPSQECFMAGTPEGHVESVSAAFNLSIDLHVFPHKLESGFIDLPLLGSQLLHPYTGWGRCLPLGLVAEVVHRGSLLLGDTFDVSLGGTRYEAFLGGVMTPPAGVRARG